MTNPFSQRTLGEFEDASASIPLRQLDRVFEGANVPLGEDPGGPAGTRRTQFRRYIAGANQHDPEQLDRLGDALGALIKEVAPSKIDFLVKAAERDGFVFVDGVFRRAGSAANSFTVTHLDDVASIEDRGRRLRLLADEHPEDATLGAKELVDSICRTALSLRGEPSPGKKADLAAIVESALARLELAPVSTDHAKKSAALVRKCLRQLGGVVADVDELRSRYGSRDGEHGAPKGLSPGHARLAVGAAVAFAGFVADTYVERAPVKRSTKRFR